MAAIFEVLWCSEFRSLLIVVRSQKQHRNDNYGTPNNTTTTSETKDAPFSEIKLATIHHDGRDISYSTSPENGSPPVLFFYPGGGNQRMLCSFRMLFSDLYFICVNRPGKGGTSPTNESGPESHLATAVQDAVVVLDKLGIERVALMCMCAGAPFCFTFAARHPERTTGQLTGISTWIQPADCGYNNSKTTLFLGTKLRPLVAPVVGLVFASIGSSLTSFPASMTLGAFRKKLAPDEREEFDEKYKDKSEFTTMMKWMQEDRGGAGNDMSVLLSANLVEYPAVVDSQNSIMLWHGTSDALVPYASAEWLASQALPGATLNTVPEGTHDGCGFLLHPSIVDSLRTLGRPHDA